MLTSAFVGRGRESAELAAGLDDLLSARGRLFVLTGEAGIGKTRLADELAKQAAARGARVLWGRCWEGGGAPAFWPWVQVLRACLTEPAARALSSEAGVEGSDFAALIPELGTRLAGLEPPGQTRPQATFSALTPGDPEAERFRLFDATANFLKQAASKAPLLIIIDDCHAADVASLLFLRFLVRDLRQARVMLIVTYREVEARLLPQIEELLGVVAREGRTIILRGIGEADVREFIELNVDRPVDPALVAALHRATEGNPFFLSEIVRLLLAEGQLGEHGASAMRRFKIPDGVQVAIRLRLKLVSTPTRDQLAIAAVIGRDFDLALMSRVTGSSTEQLLEALSEAQESGIVSEVPGALSRYRFGHGLVCQALYDDLPKLGRQQLHLRIAEGLEELYRHDLEPYLFELAHHYDLALPAGKVEKVVEYAERAAQRATELLAYEQAVHLYESAMRALNLQQPADRLRRCHLLLKLGDARYRAGLFDEARSAFAQAAESAESLASAEQLARAALGLAMLSSDPTFVDQTKLNLLGRALRAVGDGDTSLRAMLLARQAWELHWSDDGHHREALSQQAVQIARRLGDAPTLIYVLIHRHLAIWGPDNLEERFAIANELERLCEQTGNRLWTPQARYLRVADLLEKGEVHAADAVIENFSGMKEELWVPFGYRERAQAVRALIDGRFDDAERLAEQALKLGGRIAARAKMAYLDHLFALRKAQGRLSEVEASLAASIVQLPRDVYGRCALALCHCALGRVAEAQLEFYRMADDDFARIPRISVWLTSIALLAEVCAYLEDAERAAALYKLLLPYADRNISSAINACYGSAAHHLGLLATVMGQFEQAQAHFEEALRINGRMRARPFVAMTQAAYAAMLAKRGGPGDAEKALMKVTQALDTALALKMKQLAEQASQLQSRLKSRGASEAAPASSGGQQESAFRRDGDYWTITYQGEVVRLKDLKGMAYLAHLLRHPGTEFHVMDLVTAAEGGGPSASDTALDRDDALAVASDAGAMLDPEAKRAYKQRRDELRAELEEARQFNDFERADKIESDIESLTRELVRAVGLAGRERKAASDSERVRVRVTNAIRTAIAAIQRSHAALGYHLSGAVKTGLLCAYQPDPSTAIRWRTDLKV